jgi:hypothetical protein
MSYETELRDGARQVIDLLAAHQFEAEIDEASFQEYLVKINIGDWGKLKLYFSPNKQRYRTVVDELHSSLREKIQGLCDNYLGTTRKKFEETEVKPEDYILKKLAHYYGILQSYRHAKFDFISFADVLEEALSILEDKPESLAALRYDFDALETIYFEIQEKLK